MTTILLHIHDDLGMESRLQAACDLARAASAHIQCVQVTPMLETIAAGAGDGLGYAPAIAAELHAIDETFRTRIEARFAQEDVAWDWRQMEGDSLPNLLAAAKLADVIVASLPAMGQGGGGDPLPIAADLALGGRTPVLAVPLAAEGWAVTGRALVAWDGSPAAAAALRAAVPLLRLAEAVEIVTIGADGATTFPATDAPAYLARHGIKAQLHVRPHGDRTVEAALRDMITALRADWVVMGAFGHSRWRELIFGGVTRSLLRTAPVPLLLAH
ncbi:universal stress protein [Sphingobium sp. HBC34]|uniref:Universal stress protein n=1 Tax=Sphingobium cyanobacteriorum TaxID=3063954 RepID=A0ABT8ZNI3_9SPHN|nr:universal stress protein [Sphingobium sp. HBC34]MDO7835998.1 universal stress protein [Sphingobium sp. HBC34]